MQKPTDKNLVVTLLDSKGFTKQEAVMLCLLCKGLTRKEIARVRCRSFGTISKHIENIAAKLNAKSQAEIVAKAIAMGIVSIALQIVCWVFVSCFIAVTSLSEALPTVQLLAVNVGTQCG